MPLYLIERNFAEQLNVNRDAATAVTQVNADAGIQWLFSFLSADKKKTYCLYEAPNAEAIREAARKLNLPADVIVELGDQRCQESPESHPHKSFETPPTRVWGCLTRGSARGKTPSLLRIKATMFMQPVGYRILV
jgi:hypothetical protein